jgi:hypothetical protein
VKQETMKKGMKQESRKLGQKLRKAGKQEQNSEGLSKVKNPSS